MNVYQGPACTVRKKEYKTEYISKRFLLARTPNTAAGSDTNTESLTVVGNIQIDNDPPSRPVVSVP